MPLAFNLYEEFKEDGFKIDGEEKEPSDAGFLSLPTRGGFAGR